MTLVWADGLLQSLSQAAPFGIREAGWVAISAGATSIAAVATAAMAVYTHQLATKTADVLAISGTL